MDDGVGSGRVHYRLATARASVMSATRSMPSAGPTDRVPITVAPDRSQRRPQIAAELARRAGDEDARPLKRLGFWYEVPIHHEDDPDLRVVAEHEPDRLGFERGCARRATSRPISESAMRRPTSRMTLSSITIECSISQSISWQPRADRGERADVGVDEPRAGTDDGRAAHGAVRSAWPRVRSRLRRRSSSDRRRCHRCGPAGCSSTRRLASSMSSFLPVSIQSSSMMAERTGGRRRPVPGWRR